MDLPDRNTIEGRAYLSGVTRATQIKIDGFTLLNYYEAIVLNYEKLVNERASELPALRMLHSSFSSLKPYLEACKKLHEVSGGAFASDPDEGGFMYRVCCVIALPDIAEMLSLSSEDMDLFHIREGHLGVLALSFSGEEMRLPHVRPNKLPTTKLNACTDYLSRTRPDRTKVLGHGGRIGSAAWYIDADHEMYDEVLPTAISIAKQYFGLCLAKRAYRSLRDHAKTPGHIKRVAPSLIGADPKLDIYTSEAAARSPIPKAMRDWDSQQQRAFDRGVDEMRRAIALSLLTANVEPKTPGFEADVRTLMLGSYESLSKVR